MSRTSASTAACTPPLVDKPGPMTAKTNLSDVKPASGSVPMDGVANFDSEVHNEFMNLLDMINTDPGTDESRAQFDFSSLGPLPDDFLGFNFDSDAADKWPAFSTVGDSSFEYLNNNRDDTVMLSSAAYPVYLSSPDSPVTKQQLLTDPISPFPHRQLRQPQPRARFPRYLPPSPATPCPTQPRSREHDDSSDQLRH
ncbi:MAG: hypothetical protein LQ338_003814 [Usnochroma carphineum]|nr:MAG: hypothetical protein LQ338_003814 [Usnochroma carphineum]